MDAVPADAAPVDARPADAAPPLEDVCARMGSARPVIRLVAGQTTAGYAPFDAEVMGPTFRETLFPIEGSGEGTDQVRCTLEAPGPASFRLDCQDGPARKSATWALSGGRLRIEKDVGGVRSTRDVETGACAELVAELPRALSAAGAEAAPNPACPDTDAGVIVDGVLQRGKKVDERTGMRAVWFEIPRLGIRRQIGDTLRSDD